MLKLKLQYLAIWCKELTPWKRPWCWERLKVGGEDNNRGWDGWMASPTQWAWVWVNSGSWWCAGKPGMLQSMRLQTAGHEWATELSWTDRPPVRGRKPDTDTDRASITTFWVTPGCLVLTSHLISKTPQETNATVSSFTRYKVTSSGKRKYGVPCWGTGGKAESYWSEGSALPVLKDVMFILHLRIFLRGWSQDCGFSSGHV